MEEKWLEELLKETTQSSKKDAGKSSSAPSSSAAPKSSSPTPASSSSSAALQSSKNQRSPGTRAEIRRIQNKEAARRSRQKKKDDEAQLKRQLQAENERIANLEDRVNSLKTFVEKREKRKAQAAERKARYNAKTGGSSSKSSK